MCNVECAAKKRKPTYFSLRISQNLGIGTAKADALRGQGISAGGARAEMLRDEGKKSHLKKTRAEAGMPTRR
jgi:hypothetical protein